MMIVAPACLVVALLVLLTTAQDVGEYIHYGEDHFIVVGVEAQTAVLGFYATAEPLSLSRPNPPCTGRSFGRFPLTKIGGSNYTVDFSSGSLRGWYKVIEKALLDAGRIEPDDSYPPAGIQTGDFTEIHYNSGDSFLTNFRGASIEFIRVARSLSVGEFGYREETAPHLTLSYHIFTTGIVGIQATCGGQPTGRLPFRLVRRETGRPYVYYELESVGQGTLYDLLARVQYACPEKQVVFPDLSDVADLSSVTFRTDNTIVVTLEGAAVALGTVEIFRVGVCIPLEGFEMNFSTLSLNVVVGAAAIGHRTCWFSGTLSPEVCCDPNHQEGCWDGFFSYDICCHDPTPATQERFRIMDEIFGTCFDTIDAGQVDLDRTELQCRGEVHELIKDSFWKTLFFNQRLAKVSVGDSVVKHNEMSDAFFLLIAKEPQRFLLDCAQGVAVLILDMLPEISSRLGTREASWWYQLASTEIRKHQEFLGRDCRWIEMVHFHAFDHYPIFVGPREPLQDCPTDVRIYSYDSALLSADSALSCYARNKFWNTEVLFPQWLQSSRCSVKVITEADFVYVP
ncbi:hypothetical protein FOL46_001124, partial [Perkinsus olseni]